MEKAAEGFFEGAINGIRTRDPQLGKLMLYQLSYYRIFFSMQIYKILGNPQNNEE